MENNKQQWKKRVDIFRYIYTCLSNNYSYEQIIDNMNDKMSKEGHDAIKYFGQNSDNIVEQIKDLIDKTWTWDRIKTIDKAIIIEAICEYKTNQIDKRVVIDQAIINAKNYSDKQSYKFINATLDKILK